MMKAQSGGRGTLGELCNCDQRVIVNMLRRIPPQPVNLTIEDYEIDYSDCLTDDE